MRELADTEIMKKGDVYYIAGKEQFVVDGWAGSPAVELTGPTEGVIMRKETMRKTKIGDNQVAIKYGVVKVYDNEDDLQYEFTKSDVQEVKELIDRTKSQDRLEEELEEAKEAVEKAQAALEEAEERESEARDALEPELPAIAGVDVEGIDPNGIQFGCTYVTKAQVNALLRKL
jgi:hypothetical protein